MRRHKFNSELLTVNPKPASVAARQPKARVISGGYGDGGDALSEMGLHRDAYVDVARRLRGEAFCLS